MKKKLLIVDIDGFVYDASERAYLSSVEMGLNLDRLGARGLDPRNPKFSGVDFDRYYDIFDRPDHVKTDVPIAYAADTLRALRSRGLEIGYVSVRPQGENGEMEAVTKKCFKRDGVPDPDEDPGVHLILRPPHITGRDGRKMKKILVYALTRIFNVVAGGGDTPGDSKAYADNGVPALIIPSFQFGFTREDYHEGSDFFNNWIELREHVENNILGKRD